MQDLHFLRLWDIYNQLLTENQREITNLYFNCDLSLAEIAEQRGVSRQSVSDCLQKSRKQLEEYEERLGFFRKNLESDLSQSFLLTDLTRWREEAERGEPNFARLDEILKKDYTKEVNEAIENSAQLLL